MIGLVDCNNFYVSCERVFRPDLKYRPVVVLSGNDGCVIARSDEVKAMDIPMGAPYFKVKNILESHNTAVFSSNFSLYGDLSSRVMEIIDSLVPKSEIYSIDEIFIDFSGINAPYSLAKHLRETVLKNVGIPTSIGVSLTKTLAKVANRSAKKNPEKKGICILVDVNEIDSLLNHMKTEDIWGIGSKSSHKLTAHQIRTALDLKKVDPKWMRKYFTITGERIVMELNGFKCLDIDDITEPRKSIQLTRTFPKGISEFEELRKKIASFAFKLGEKLRRHDLLAQSVEVFIRTNHLNETEKQYSNSMICALPHLTNDTFVILDVCTKLLENLYKPGFSFKKAGITVYDLIPNDPKGSIQLNLFETSSKEDPKTNSLLKAVDSINRRFGPDTMKIASGTISRKRTNALSYSQSHKSPAYTTDWKQLPIVK